MSDTSVVSDPSSSVRDTEISAGNIYIFIHRDNTDI